MHRDGLYRTNDTSTRVLAADLQAQLLPETFDHAVNHLLDHEIDLRGFAARFNGDDTGASVHPPGMLLKVVLLAYSRRIVFSRAIERACREHVTFTALSGDSCPHFNPIAAFVSGLGELIGNVFQQGLLICDARGLIGREQQSLLCTHRLPEGFEAERIDCIDRMRGLVAGIGLAQLIHATLPAAPMRTHFGYAVLAVALTAMVGLAAGVLPARRASKLDPVDSLRAE